jgi:NAD(P)-dependent dehydrogenase (short-subunit alcohol dehydrogenase family)
MVEKEAVRCHTAIVDVRERSAVWKAIADGVAELGGLDIVVANAGICAMGKGQTMQSWSDTIDTDLVGVFNVNQASLPYISDGGSIIATARLRPNWLAPPTRVPADRHTAWPSRSWRATSTTCRSSWPSA